MNRLIVGLIAGVLAGFILGMVSQNSDAYHPLSEAHGSPSANQQGAQPAAGGDYGFAFYRRSGSYIH